MSAENFFDALIRFDCNLSKMLLKWGIATVGNIAHDFVTALSTLPREDHQVVAVAARNISKAKAFAELHVIPVAYEGYETFAADPNVGKFKRPKQCTFMVIGTCHAALREDF